MARTVDAPRETRSERPLAGRIFGLFTPVLNHFVTRIAGKRYVPLYVLLRHQGRRSGRAYATPVVGMRVPGGFAIPMAFGEGADWYRNIVASGGATIRQHGTEHQVIDPAAIDPDSAASPFPGWQRPVFRALGIRRFLFLKGS
ncbi:MAG: nitroreductase family deazaflavin-dependent oxidoreductase [Chloroflexota bacterium]|nr:nitroreductase family deazaflavin-dependent oxidoreductase [Chloroflexota bacterium]MDP9336148.1 nitroreductase family deazaflavin-dependent oxidoreductase [Actinomycetota bacterium]